MATVSGRSRTRSPVKRVAHRVRIERLRLDHVLQRLMVDRVAFVLQRVEGEHHVVGGERRAVGELRLGPQIEGDRLAVVGDLGALGHQPVDRVRLVGRRHHQRVEQQLEPLRRVAFQNVVVEAVEGGDAAPADQRERAALGRVGIGIGEMLEIGRVGEIAEGREAVLCFPRRPPGREGWRERGLLRRRSIAMAAGRAPSELRRSRQLVGERLVEPPDLQEGWRQARQLSWAGRSGSNRRCAHWASTIAARRGRSTAARGRARWWRRPARRDPWRRSRGRSACRWPGS